MNRHAKHPAIHFTTGARDERAPKPSGISNHAVDRLIERYGQAFGFKVGDRHQGAEWARALRILTNITNDPARYLESYEPSDLRGLGQAVYVGRAVINAQPVRFTVDGNGTVRTVLPW